MHARAATVQPGWDATLELTFESRQARTVLARNRHRGPLQVQRALYPEGPHVCHVAVLHPPGGIAASDSLCVEAELEGSSRAVLTTPGATKWYRSEGARASQQLKFSVKGDAILEWLPRENILFAGSSVSMTLDIELSANSTYFGWEILCFGRRASGESWHRGSLHLNTSIRRGDRALWTETGNVEAGAGFSGSPVGLSGRTVCGTFLVAGSDIESDLLAACRRVEPAGATSRVGLTRVPDVLIARYLGDSSEDVFHYFTGLWRVLRPALTARAACAPRLWTC